MKVEQQRLLIVHVLSGTADGDESQLAAYFPNTNMLFRKRLEPSMAVVPVAAHSWRR
jgi:hypothetical protein